MAKIRPQHTDEELHALSHHLLYEIEMLHDSYSYLATIFTMPSQERPRRLINALLESWALHVRNLLSFLYDDRPSKGAAIAGDFVDDWVAIRGAKPDVLRVAHLKASKEMAHILWHRIQLDDDQKLWHTEPIVLELGAALRSFLKAAPDSSLPPGFREVAEASLPSATAQLSSHGVSIASQSAVTLAQLTQS
jgi:hypothetical protein